MLRIGSRLAAALACGAVVVAGSSASPAAAANGCTGVSKCKVVSTADVDGDGRSDSVGLVQSGIGDGRLGRVQVRVRTAKGRVMTTSHDARWYGTSTWHGAARFDGRAGYELVLGSDVGAHAMFFRVIAYRNGQLTTLKAPGGAYRWAIDSAALYGAGWTRKVSSSGAVVMISTYPHQVYDHGWVIESTRYRWSNGAWARTSSDIQVMASDRAAYDAMGWRVPYLKRFPTF